MSAPSSQSTSTSATSEILGGDYAGLSATFSSKTGELVPVPEHLVPESMLEWGEIPSSLETLASEDWDADGDAFERTTIAVLPEVGCGIDNLEVTKKTETYSGEEKRWASWGEQNPERARAAIDRVRGRTVDVETLFRVNPEVDEDGKSFDCRVRVSLSVDMPKEEGEDPTLSKLITLQVERQVSPESTQGTAWSGPSFNSGGLDARTVMNTIGKDIVYGDVFGVKRMKVGGTLWDLGVDLEEDTQILWIERITSAGKAGVIDGAKGDFLVSKDSPVTVLLPQNIMVRYGPLAGNASWGLEVSHFFDMKEEEDCIQRRGVLRSFPNSGLDGKDGKSSLGEVSSYSTKEKKPSR